MKNKKEASGKKLQKLEQKKNNFSSSRSSSLEEDEIDLDMGAETSLNISAIIVSSLMISMLGIIAAFATYTFPYFMENSTEQDWNEDYPYEPPERIQPRSNFKSPSTQTESNPQKLLRSSYTFSFEEALEQRMMAMKMYSYPHAIDGIDKRSGLSLQEFKDVYDGKWPVILTDVVPSWPAFNWSKQFFLDKYGDKTVVMTAVHGTTMETLALPLKLYLSHLDDSSLNSWTYLMDEHFLPQHSELRSQVFETPYLQQNFFKLFPQEVQPWDCMLLWGTSFSRSTLHIDPYNWTGTNAVIMGEKRWKLIPPGQDEHLLIKPQGTCGFPLECNKYNSKIDAFWPEEAHQDHLAKVKVLETVQRDGELLIIPTGWFHQAYNTVPTLAVSGQVMNSNNYLVVLEEILKGGSFDRSDLPDDLELSPHELVEKIMSKLSPAIIEHGHQVTKDALKQIDEEVPKP